MLYISKIHMFCFVDFAHVKEYQSSKLLALCEGNSIYITSSEMRKLFLYHGAPTYDHFCCRLVVITITIAVIIMIFLVVIVIIFITTIIIMITAIFVVTSTIIIIIVIMIIVIIIFIVCT